MSFDISKYREMFLEEAEELFESADNVLLEAENNGSLTDDEMGQLFRDVHTLKGSGASVELKLFAEFTHDVENLMDKLRNHEIEFIPEMAGTLIDGLDVMKEILDLEVAEELTQEAFTEMSKDLLEDIRAYSSGNAPASAAQVQTASPDPVEAVTQEVMLPNSSNEQSDNIGFYEDSLDDQVSTNSYGFFADDDAYDNANDAYGFFDDALEEASKTAPDVQSKELDDDDCFGFFDDVEPITPDSVMQSNDIVKEEVKEVAVQEAPSAAPKAPSATPNAPAAKAARKPREVKEGAGKKAAASNNIRVNLDKIDVLMNNVGDLVITNAMLTQYSTTIEEAKTRNSVLERLELLERHIRDMQDSIMSIRMVPMESIYSKFPKVVRDISKKLDKKVEFKHYGDNVEIDKAMIEA